MGSKKSLKFIYQENREKNKEQVFVSQDERDEEATLTEFDRRHFEDIRREVLADGSGGAKIAIKSVDIDGEVRHGSFSDMINSVPLENIERVTFGDQEVLLMSEAMTGSVEEKVKAKQAEVKQNTLSELAKKDPKIIDDLSVALDHFFRKTIEEKGANNLAKFTEYIEKCSIQVLSETVPPIIIETVADMQKIRYNPKPEFNKVRDFLKALFDMTYSSGELNDFIRSNQQMMDLASFIQSAGIDAMEFLTNRDGFTKIEQQMKNLIKPNAEEDEKLTIHNDLFQKLANFISLKAAYTDLSTVCDRIKYLLTEFNHQELYDIANKCYAFAKEIETTRTQEREEYTNAHTQYNKETGEPNENFNADDVTKYLRDFDHETKQRIDQVLSDFAPELKLNSDDKMTIIIRTLVNDISLGLNTDTFDLDYAMRCMDIKKTKVDFEINLCQEFIEFLPSVMSFDRVRQSVEFLKSRSAFNAKLKKISDIDEKAKTILKSFKKVDLPIAVIGATGKTGISINEAYFNLHEKMRENYVKVSKHFLSTPGETRRIPTFDITILSFVYLMVLDNVLDRFVEETWNKFDKNAEQLNRQTTFKILQYKVSEVSNFISMMQMQDENSIYTLFTLFEEYANELNIKGTKPFTVELDVKVIDAHEISETEE